MAVDYENLFVEESRLSPRAAKSKWPRPTSWGACPDRRGIRRPHFRFEARTLDCSDRHGCSEKAV